jgi:hypothetical protein
MHNTTARCVGISSTHGSAVRSFALLLAVSVARVRVLLS